MPATRFAYRLALALGEPDVDGMLESMSGNQFARWHEFFSIEPFGPRQDETRAAVLASLVYNGLYKGDRLRHSDFFPSLREDGEDSHDADDQDPVVLSAMMQAWVLAKGGKVVEDVPGRGPSKPEVDL